MATVRFGVGSVISKAVRLDAVFFFHLPAQFDAMTVCYAAFCWLLFFATPQGLG